MEWKLEATELGHQICSLNREIWASGLKAFITNVYAEEKNKQ